MPIRALPNSIIRTTCDKLIGTFGWAVQGVERDGIHPPWPIGRAHLPPPPELVITGMGLTRATQVLNGVAAHVLHAAAPDPGTQAALLVGPLVEVVRVAAPWAHLNMAVDFTAGGSAACNWCTPTSAGAGPGTTRIRACAAGSPCWVPGSRRIAGGGWGERVG